jgi:hypothetical protein
MHPAAVRLTNDSTEFDDQWHQWMTGSCNPFPYTSKIQAFDTTCRRNRIRGLTGNHFKISLTQGERRFDHKPSLPSFLRAEQRLDSGIRYT